MEPMDLTQLTSMNADELTSLGRDLILAGQHEQAVTVLQTALGKDLASRRAYALLEYLLEEHGNYAASMELHEDYRWLSLGRDIKEN
jgi:hypothetical protein